MRSSWRSTPTARRSWLPPATATRPARLSRRPTWPAACPGAIGVAATDDERPAGELLELRQPGRLRLGSRRRTSSRPGRATRTRWTSTGPRWRPRTWPALVGLIRSLHPEASVGQVRQILALELRQGRRVAHTAPTRTACARAAPGKRTTATAGSTSSRRSRRPSRRRRRLPLPAAAAATASAAADLGDRTRRHRSCTSTRRAAATGSHAATALPRAGRQRPDLGAGASSTGRRSC